MFTRSMVIYRLITGCLLVCLQLQACVVSIAFVLGTRHTHQEPAIQLVALDSMEGWQDFRRVSHDDSTRLSRQANEAEHASLHRHGVRHHHDAADSSVIRDDASLIEETAASGFVQSDAGALYIKTALTPDIAPAVEIFRSRWVMATLPTIASPRPWRIERPPQHASAPVTSHT
jgi:hypothetical protein